MRNGLGVMEQTIPGRRHIQFMIAAAIIIAALTACGQSDVGFHQESGAQDGMWSEHIRKVHDALAKKDISGAEQAWHYAHVAGLRSGSWKSMIEVGDAALCIGEAAGFRQGSSDRARESYSVALIRARLQESNEGLRRTAQAFTALGDRGAIDQCFQIAKRLRTRPPATRAIAPSASMAAGT